MNFATKTTFFNSNQNTKNITGNSFSNGGRNGEILDMKTPPPLYVSWPTTLKNLLALYKFWGFPHMIKVLAAYTHDLNIWSILEVIRLDLG